MSSASRPRPRSVRSRMAWSIFLAFGFLGALAVSATLLLTIRHTTREYHEELGRLIDDLVAEYGACGGDVGTMKGHFAVDAEEHGSDNVFLLLAEPGGRVLLSHSASAGILRRMLGELTSPNMRKTCRIEQDAAGERRRAVAVRVRNKRLPDGRLLAVGYNVTDDEALVFSLSVSMGSMLVLMLFAAAAVATALSRRFTRPLQNISEAARRIRGGDYSTRVPLTPGELEISELENAFNMMCEQNEKTLSELRVLTDNIAHDLRTPLTRLRAAAEMSATGGDLRRPLDETVSEETSAMLDMINTMLEISQTDYRIDSTPREEIELGAFVRGVVELYSVLAEESGIELAVDVPSEPVPFSGHRSKLQQLAGNLLDNAVKFTPRGGRISVSLAADPPRLAVTNTGPGIAPEDIPHVFKRFWRADANRSLPGNGLGLALVKAIATSYGGSVECISVQGGETKFTVSLDAASGHADGTSF